MRQVTHQCPQCEDDGLNVGDEITCKLCKKIDADPKHWRNRKANQVA